MTTLPAGLDLFSNVVFARYGQREVTMDILRPQSRPAGGPLPAILHVHGGGWKVRDRKALLSDIVRVAQRGYVAATMTYRLSGEARFPAQIQDVTCAVRYLRANAAEIGLDPARIGAWGYSAGGHLAALLAVAADVPAFAGDGGWAGIDSRVQAVCNCCGVTDVGRWAPGGHENDDGHPDQYTALLLGGPMAERRDQARAASPVAYASRSAAPILTVHGDEDEAVPIEQARLFHRALITAGAASELLELPGGRHEFGGPAVDRVVDAFFDRMLAAPAVGHG